MKRNSPERGILRKQKAMQINMNYYEFSLTSGSVFRTFQREN